MATDGLSPRVKRPKSLTLHEKLDEVQLPVTFNNWAGQQRGQ